MGMERVSAFMAALPARGITGRDLGRWRTAVEEFEVSLGRAAGRPFAKYEINRFVQQKRVSGASEQDAAFLTAALADYQQFCDSQPPPDAGHAATAIRPPAPSAFKKIELTDEERGAMRRKQLQVLGGTLAVVAILGGCVGSYFHRSSRLRTFSSAVRSEARRVTGPNDTEDLKLRVMALAQEHKMKVTTDDVTTFIGELTPHRMGMLAQSERIAVMELMQSNTQQQISATRGERGRIKEPAPIWYVDVTVRGKVPSLFGGTDFEFENHVAVSEDLPHFAP
jgi:molybdopterin synthase catalytic subunit